MVLHGVADEVGKHLLQLHGVGGEGGQKKGQLHGKAHGQAQRIDDVAQQRAHKHGFLSPHRAPDAGQVQNAGNQLFHAVHPLPHQGQKLADVRGQLLRAHVFFNPTRSTLDAPQRRFQVVRHHVGKLVELLVAVFELRNVGAHRPRHGVQGRGQLAHLVVSGVHYLG